MKNKSLGRIILEYGSYGAAIGSIEALMLSSAFDNILSIWISCLLTGFSTGILIAVQIRETERKNK